jgi:hypothetical protein
MPLVPFVNDDWMVGKCYSSVGFFLRIRRIKPTTQPRHVVCMFRYPSKQETECTQWALMSQNSWIVLASHSGPSLALRVYPKWRSGGSVLHTASELYYSCTFGRLQLKCVGIRWRTGGEVKGKLANGVGSQYPLHYLGTWCIQHYCRWWAHLGCQ